MSSILLRLVSMPAFASTRPGSAKARPRKGLVCEALETREVMNAAWATPGVSGAWAGGPADVHHSGKTGAAGDHAFTPPTLSAAAQADLKTLQADQKALQTEVEADAGVKTLADTVKADGAVIQKALGTAFPKDAGPGHHANGSRPQGHGFVKGNDPALDTRFRGQPGPGGPLGFGHGPGEGKAADATLPAAVVTKLEAAGVTADQITKFEADQKALQTAVQAIDPTLQAKIQAEEKTLQGELPAPPMHFNHIKAATTPATTG